MQNNKDVGQKQKQKYTKKWQEHENLAVLHVLLDGKYLELKNNVQHNHKVYQAFIDILKNRGVKGVTVSNLKNKIESLVL